MEVPEAEIKCRAIGGEGFLISEVLFSHHRTLILYPVTGTTPWERFGKLLQEEDLGMRNEEKFCKDSLKDLLALRKDNSFTQRKVTIFYLVQECKTQTNLSYKEGRFWTRDREVSPLPLLHSCVETRQLLVREGLRQIPQLHKARLVGSFRLSRSFSWNRGTAEI